MWHLEESHKSLGHTESHITVGDNYVVPTLDILKIKSVVEPTQYGAQWASMTSVIAWVYGWPSVRVS